MRIVVTTPTGHVGSRVVGLLLQAGARPTLLLRDPARLDDATRKLVDAVQGDQGDAEAVARATEGADALFWVDPPTNADDPIATSAMMGANAARAVEQTGSPVPCFRAASAQRNVPGQGTLQTAMPIDAPMPWVDPRDIGAVQVPDDDLREALRSAGLSDKQVEGILGMSTGLREDFVPEDARSVLTTTPTTLAAWAYEHLRLAT